MRSFLELVIKYPSATALVVALAGIMGVYALWHMPVDLFPGLEVPVINIITHYPGAAPEDMEMLVSRPIEDEMRTIPDVKRVASTSVQGLSQVTIEFSWGTAVRDARQLVQARLARLKNTLPAGVNPRLENIGTTLQEVCGYLVYGAGDPVALGNKVRHDIAGRLMSIPGVSSVDVMGGDRRAFYVELRPEALARLHVSLTEIMAILRNHNVNAVAGFIGRSGREYLVRGDARLKTIEDLRSLPVLKDGERSVLLGSISYIHEGRAPRHYVVHGDGVPAVALVVHKQPGASTVNVVSNVDKELAGLRRLLPAGSSVKKFYDQSEIIRESQHEIVQDLIIGAVLAVLVLYFFLGHMRPTMIVALTIPLALLVTIAVMRLFGMSFNVITMTALALAIGVIVDDAIVVAENIHRHGRLSFDTVSASIVGAAEIAGPDASGTFTTVAAFLPLVIVTGIAGLFLKPFGLAVSTALVVSLILSLTLVPLLFSRSRKAVFQRGGFLGDRLLHRLDELLQAELASAFRHRRAVISAAIIFLGLAGVTVLSDKVSLLPPIDEGTILVEYVMPPGTSLEESDRIGRTIERVALSTPGVSCVYRRTGSPKSGYQIEGVNKGELLIKLKPKNERDRSASGITASLKKAYSRLDGVVLLYHQPTQEKIDESFSGLPAFFGVTIYGPDTEELASLADRVEKTLSEDPAVSNVVNNTKVKASEIDVRVDYARAAQLGMEPEDIFAALQASNLGIEATRIIRQNEDVAVMVKLDAGKLLDLDSLHRLPVLTADGAAVPLQGVADVRINQTPAAITRLNGQREVTLVAEVDGNIPGIVSRLRKKFASIGMPGDYSIEFSGQYKVLIKSATEVFFAVACAVFLIYLIMAMQFGSWLQPLIILVTVPLALAGAFIALFVTREGLDVSVGMGAVTLAGIAVNNGIVLVDFANRQAAAGKTAMEAMLSAASVRLRPILLTTLTTIAALLPAAMGMSGGSRIFQPFAVTVIGGLVTSVCATLIIVPTLAVMFGHPKGEK